MSESGSSTVLYWVGGILAAAGVAVGGAFLVSDGVFPGAQNGEVALPQTESEAEPREAVVTPEPEATEEVANEEDVADAPAVDEPEPPRLQEVRVEPDGLAVIAGRAAPGTDVIVRADGQEVARASADGSGAFATVAFLEPSDGVRVLTLFQITEDGSEVQSPDEMILAPVAAPVVAEESAPEDSTTEVADATEAVEEEPVEAAQATETVEETTDVADSTDTTEEETVEVEQAPEAVEEETVEMAQAPEVIEEESSEVSSVETTEAATEETVEQSVEVAEAEEAEAPKPTLTQLETAAGSVVTVAEAATDAPALKSEPTVTEVETADADPKQPETTTSEETEVAQTEATEESSDIAKTQDVAVTETEQTDADQSASATVISTQSATPKAEEDEAVELALAQEPKAETPSALAQPEATEATETDTPAETEQAPVTNSEEDAPKEEAATEEPAPAPQPTQQIAVLKSNEEGVSVVKPDAPAPEVLSQIELDTISYSDQGAVELQGRAQQDASEVRVYLNNRPVTALEIDGSGAWRGALPDVDTGVYTLRIDEVNEAGEVTSRVETPFKREDPEVLAAATEDTGASVSAVTVQKGDSLWAISRKRYGEGLLYVRVFQANRDLIRNPDLIYPGQIFTLPDN